MKRDIIKKEKGSISTLVLFTVLMFSVILMGVFLSITTRQKSQLKSDMRIIDIYGRDVEIVDEVYEELPKIKLSELKVGDYIKYDTGKTEIGDNGIVVCRVLYNDETNGLQIITDRCITQKLDGVDKEVEVTLGVDGDYEVSVESYNNAIEALNNETEKYLNTKYANDARCVGSLPTVNANGIFTKKDNGATNYVTLEYNNTNYINTLDEDENYKNDCTVLNSEGMMFAGKHYWLASRLVEWTNYNYFFDMRVVLSYETGSGRTYHTICEVYKGTNAVKGLTGKYGLRPCFSLKSNIKITAGKGTSNEPYILGI